MAAPADRPPTGGSAGIRRRLELAAKLRPGDRERGAADLKAGVGGERLDVEEYVQTEPRKRSSREQPSWECLEARGSEVGVEGDRALDPLPAHEGEARPIHQRDR
jgi:hypothetical protein